MMSHALKSIGYCLYISPLFFYFAADTEAPVLVDCPSDITREIPVGSTAVSVSWTAPTATDNSLANIVPQVSPRGPGAFNAGNTVITYTATDAAGNEATCSFRVIVSVGGT